MGADGFLEYSTERRRVNDIADFDTQLEPYSTARCVLQSKGRSSHNCNAARAWCFWIPSPLDTTCSQDVAPDRYGKVLTKSQRLTMNRETS